MTFEELKKHIGHKLNIVNYSDENISIECETCACKIFSVDKTVIKPKKKSRSFDRIKYAKYEGERGSKEQWQEAAKAVLSVGEETCLEILGIAGVPETEAQLKKIYRDLMLVNHPDRGGDEEKAAKINSAYDLALKLYFSQSESSKKMEKKSARKDTGLRPQLLNPIDESEVQKYLNDDDFCCQEKEDGKHGILEQKEGTLTAANKNGLEMAVSKRIEQAFKALGFDITLDGELIGEKFYIFDLLDLKGENYRSKPYNERYFAYQEILKDKDILIPVKAYFGTKEKTEFYYRMKAEKREGVVLKRISAAFVPGRPSEYGDFLKCKFWASLSAIVSEGSTGKSSFAFYVLDGGKRIYLGQCTTIGKVIPKAGDVVEIKYLYAYKGGKVIQPVFLSIRDDVNREDCNLKQLKYKVEKE
jgi:bifunctional non-homologous end joining protein LigD